MRLLLDQDVYSVTTGFLRAVGHDCVTASELGLSRAADSELLARASELGRILVTRDKDFGGLVFLTRLGSGVVFLRAELVTLGLVHAQLESVFSTYTEDELRGAFVVVEPGRHRFRKLPR